MRQTVALYLLIPALVVVGALTTAGEAIHARLVRAALAVATGQHWTVPPGEYLPCLEEAAP